MKWKIKSKRWLSKPCCFPSKKKNIIGRKTTKTNTSSQNKFKNCPILHYRWNINLGMIQDTFSHSNWLSTEMTRSLHLKSSQKNGWKKKTETHTVDLMEVSDLLSFILIAHRNTEERNWWKRKAFFVICIILHVVKRIPMTN